MYIFRAILTTYVCTYYSQHDREHLGLRESRPNNSV